MRAAAFAQDVTAILNWGETTTGDISFKPARVIMQDMSGGPCLMDLEAMRRRVSDLGKDPASVNPLVPVDLVIDHSVIADQSGAQNSLRSNMRLEFDRNRERFALFKWAAQAFTNLSVVPPGAGIIHQARLSHCVSQRLVGLIPVALWQVNLEYLARGVFEAEGGLLYPDTMVGTDSHSTMVNGTQPEFRVFTSGINLIFILPGLGIVGWGVGGIEALSVMLGQPIVMVLPDVVGVELGGVLQKGVTATDLVLQIVQALRKEGVVGKFVEFFGEGVRCLSLADRATVANMAPEYGATMGFFPVDEITLGYYRSTGRPASSVELAGQYLRENSLFNSRESWEGIRYSKALHVDLSSVQPCVSGPKRPHDRILLQDLKADFEMYTPTARLV